MSQAPHAAARILPPPPSPHTQGGKQLVSTCTRGPGQRPATGAARPPCMGGGSGRVGGGSKRGVASLAQPPQPPFPHPSHPPSQEAKLPPLAPGCQTARAQTWQTPRAAPRRPLPPALAPPRGEPLPPGCRHTQRRGGGEGGCEDEGRGSGETGWRRRAHTRTHAHTRTRSPTPLPHCLALAWPQTLACRRPPGPY